MPFAKIFRSRWSALLWAGGILWTAYDVAESAPHPAAGNTIARDATGDTVDLADLGAIANAASGAAH
jgi:hypothetical protein